MVWYQLFEYAIGHWFQKATEHVLGCVLCSPGCFSLFRGLSVLDDNVMKTYTRNVEKAVDYLQCEQGIIMKYLLIINYYERSAIFNTHRGNGTK